MAKNDLENFYKQAQQAIQTKDFNRATDLLTQILVIDENYKDTSRLLARIVKEKRRRWYNDPRIWGVFVGLVVVGLLILFVPKLPLTALFASATMVSETTSTSISTETTTPRDLITPVPIFLPTSIPLTWERVSMGLDFPTDAITSIVVDSNDLDVIYIGMKNAGVFKSIDGGLSWSPVDQGLANTHVESLIIDPQQPEILYSGTLGGIYKTQDGGRKWESIFDGRRLLMDFKNSSHLYASGGGNVSESTDKGITWLEHKNNCPKIANWAIDPLDGMILFAVDSGNDPSCKMGLYKSSDGARSWSFLGFEGQSNFEITVGVNEEGHELLYAYSPSQGYQISNNSGISWKTLETTTSCSFLPVDSISPDTIYCANQFSDVMIYQSGRFVGAYTISSPSNLQVNAFHVDRYQGTSRIIAGGQGLYISSDNGQSWSNRSGGLGASRLELKIDPINNERMFLASYVGSDENTCTLFRSDDSGKSWKTIMPKAFWCGPVFGATNGLYLLGGNGDLENSTDYGKTWNSSPLPSGMGFGGVSANPYSPGFLFATSQELYYSNDFGSTWLRVQNSSSNWYNNRFYYAEGGNLIYSLYLFSTDGGKSWNSCSDPEIRIPDSDSQMLIDPQDTAHLYLATGGEGILQSDDGCQTWQSHNKGLGNLNVNSIALDPNNSNMIFAGTNGGAYVTNDQGQTWGQINNGLLGVLTVYSIAIDSQSNIYAATPYGIFKLGNR